MHDNQCVGKPRGHPCFDVALGHFLKYRATRKFIDILCRLSAGGSLAVA